MKSILLVIGIVIFSGCALVPVETVPELEVTDLRESENGSGKAMIIGFSSDVEELGLTTRQGVRIILVDGKLLKSSWHGALIMPGEHEIEVMMCCGMNSTRKPVKLNVNLEFGGRYIIRGLVEKAAFVSFWVEDINTGVTVAGNRPERAKSMDAWEKVKRIYDGYRSYLNSI
ncbi:MAG: hypothetical protein K6L81_08975 [Agarilytica sp.]